MKSILDHSFRYTSDTDLRTTFVRIRREQRQQAQVEGEKLRKVFQIWQRKHAAVS